MAKSDPVDDNSLVAVSLLPYDIFIRIDESFSSVVQLLAGDSVCKILRLQLINAARKLLNTPDVFAFFHIESEETDSIKIESCFKSRTGQYIVKKGIQTDRSYFIKLLQQKLQQEREVPPSIDDDGQIEYVNEEFLSRHPLLKALVKWYQQNDSETGGKTNIFLVSFIDNLTSNLKRS
jgi:hypothetical protein